MIRDIVFRTISAVLATGLIAVALLGYPPNANAYLIVSHALMTLVFASHALFGSEAADAVWKRMH